MYVSFLAALERKTGKLKMFAMGASAIAGAPAAEAAKAYALILSGTSEGEEARAKFSHCLFVVDNHVRNSHHFPDIAAQEQDAMRLKRFTDAKKQLDDVTARLRTLQEQRESVIREHEGARSAFVSAGGPVSDAPPAYRADVELRSLQQEHEKAVADLAKIQEEHEASKKTAEELEAKLKALATPADKAADPKQAADQADVAK